MGETRVDLQHLLEDLRDAYTGALEETILTEVVANALDSGAVHIVRRKSCVIQMLPVCSPRLKRILSRATAISGAPRYRFFHESPLAVEVLDAQRRPGGSPRRRIESLRPQTRRAIAVRPEVQEARVGRPRWVPRRPD